MLRFIPIGPVVLPTYPFLSLVGFWVGMWLAAKEAERLNIDGDHLYNIGLYAFLSSLIMGRIWYVLTHWAAYAQAPSEIFALTANAIALYPAIIIALIVSIVYCRKNSLPILTMADIAAPSIAIGLIIGGIGAFLGSQTLGVVTTLPWGINQYGDLRHPAHLYLVFANLLILAIIWKVRLKPPWVGFVFLLFLELYASSHLLLNPFFDLPLTLGNGLRQIQVLALFIMLAVLIIMARVEAIRNQRQGIKNL